MALEFTPLIEELQGKLVSISLCTEEPKVALLYDDNKMIFIDTNKGEILLPPEGQEGKYGGGPVRVLG